MGINHVCCVDCGIKMRKLKVHVDDSGNVSWNVTSRLFNCSFIIPGRLAGKTFANLLIYMELTLGTQNKVMSRRWLNENGFKFKIPVQSVKATKYLMLNKLPIKRYISPRWI